jgi:general secretion pathway protein L
MSILVVLIPSRARLRARRADGIEPETHWTGAEFQYVLSSDGFSLDTQGRCAAALLPRATMVVAAISDTDVSWHRIVLPRAPSARLRAALKGVLEETLLDETGDDVHLAVAPEATAGQPTWIAAMDRKWLAHELAALERATVFVDRVVPMSWPDDPPSGHFAEAQPGTDGAVGTLSLTWAHPDGVATFRLQGGLARALLPSPLPEGARWSATPAAATAAEQWLGGPMAVMTPSMRALQATRTTWNLRQFDLAPRHRGTRALRDAVRYFKAPHWRPVRIGLVALAALQVVGLNLWAWHQRAEIEERQDAMVTLLRTTFPQVRAVLDAPVQMQREADSVRTAAGRAGDADLEPMLAAAALAWPSDRPAVESLRFEPGRLTLAAAGWGNAEIEQFRTRLRPTGWQVELSEGRLIVTRAIARPAGAS